MFVIHFDTWGIPHVWRTGIPMIPTGCLVPSTRLGKQPCLRGRDLDISSPVVRRMKPFRFVRAKMVLRYTLAWLPMVVLAHLNGTLRGFTYGSVLPELGTVRK